VKFVLPRHELSDLLGISYRRIPVLAIGNDVYCDTSLIASALERRFPASMGFGTIYPPRKDGGKMDVGIIGAFSRYYAENTLFPLAFTLLQWDRFPPSFVQDRSDACISYLFSPFSFLNFRHIQFHGSAIDPKTLVALQPESISVLSSHLVNICTLVYRLLLLFVAHDPGSIS
jgi:hypothetical protein